MKISNIYALLGDWRQIKSNRANKRHGKSHIDIPTCFDLIRSTVVVEESAELWQFVNHIELQL